MNSAVFKAFIFSIVFLLAGTMLRAQNGYNYPQYGIGAGVSSVRAYGNLKKNYDRFAFDVTAFYNYSPYVPIGAELQFGTLSGGSNTNRKIDASGRQYTNGYKAFILHADLQLGSTIDYRDNFWLNILKNFYAGTGLGAMYNHMEFIQRKDPYNIPYGNFPGTDHSLNFMIPFRFGYEVKFYNYYDEPAFTVDFGYRHSLVFGEGMDGYDDPNNIFKNNSVNQYRQIYIGIKFNFGNPVAYNKNIRRF